jgi:hypothetical protein
MTIGDHKKRGRLGCKLLGCVNGSDFMDNRVEMVKMEKYIYGVISSIQSQ